MVGRVSTEFDHNLLFIIAFQLGSPKNAPTRATTWSWMLPDICGASSDSLMPAVVFASAGQGKAQIFRNFGY
jgi:hypothetical protein